MQSFMPAVKVEEAASGIKRQKNKEELPAVSALHRSGLIFKTCEQQTQLLSQLQVLLELFWLLFFIRIL